MSIYVNEIRVSATIRRGAIMLAASLAAVERLADCVRGRSSHSAARSLVERLRSALREADQGDAGTAGTLMWYAIGQARSIGWHSVASELQRAYDTLREYHSPPGAEPGH